MTKILRFDNLTAYRPLLSAPVLHGFLSLAKAVFSQLTIFRINVGDQCSVVRFRFSALITIPWNQSFLNRVFSVTLSNIQRIAMD